MPINDPELAPIIKDALLNYNICRKCYAKNPPTATKCRRCRSKNLRPKRRERSA